MGINTIMIHIENTIISEDILEKEFVCNISSCKGNCCVEGDAGAPIEEDEVKILQEIYPKIKHLLRKQGIEAIEKQGLYTINSEGEKETTLVNNKECAYASIDKKKGVSCSIERAYNQKLIDWKKPISCHLYPIRIKNYPKFSALNYDKWEICNDACSFGKELKLPLYKFLKEALIRKFGEKWYAKLEKKSSTYKKH